MDLEIRESFGTIPQRMLRLKYPTISLSGVRAKYTLARSLFSYDIAL